MTFLPDTADPHGAPRGLRADWTLHIRGEIPTIPGVTTAARIPRPAPPARFAFARRLNALAKPFVFTDAAALARHIHRRRAGRAIQIQDVLDLREAGVTGLSRVLPRGRPCPGVQVLVMEDGQPVETLGWAFIDGGSARALMAALRAQPIPLSPRQAAD